MKETREIIAAHAKAVALGKKTVLATVVHVEGSSYRRPGARMLVTEDGELTGAISGGCLEGDALKKALLAIAQQKNKLVTYNTLDEDDHSLGIQLGCNGIVYILFEPIDTAALNNPIALLEKAAAQTKPGVLVTLFCLDDPAAEQPGTCLLATGNSYTGHIKNPALQAAIERDIEKVLESFESKIKKYPVGNSAALNGFAELVKPPVQLVIAGAGNDAFPLVQMANILGWQVTVTDGRRTHANEQRFSAAKKIIVARPAEALQSIDITAQTVFVLMSHNYNYDMAMLQQLIKTSCTYIGALGPRKKLEKMLQELEESGMRITANEKEKIYGPTGLDIGAETAEEIALSIIAEIKTVLEKRKGGMLRQKNGPIHSGNILPANMPVCLQNIQSA
ncbi:MAG TPA: XdhC family protein [Ferruginibacter sp.]|nr:XdhC family protein [Ferruginibacter sp.]HMP19337.1 XdhC family protein [Ferruginibacter sp.]